MKPETIHQRANDLMNNSQIAVRISELKGEIRAMVNALPDYVTRAVQ